MVQFLACMHFLSFPPLQIQNQTQQGLGNTARIAAGVGLGRVRVWEQMRGPWNGDAAIETDKGPILKAMRKARLGKRSHTLLENSHKCSQCQEAGKTKGEIGLKVFGIPVRSPGFND